MLKHPILTIVVDADIKCELDCIEKSEFNESRLNVNPGAKEQNLVTKMEFDIKKSQLSIKSQFKESKCAERGHSFIQDFTVHVLRS